MLCLVILLHLLSQGGNHGILSGIVKGLRAPKPKYHESNSKADFSHLEAIFARKIIPEPLMATDEPEAVDLTIGFTPFCLFVNIFLLLAPLYCTFYLV